MKLRERKNKAAQSRPDVIIGKQGLYQSMVEELDRRLDEKEIIKVKMLRTAERAEEAGRREIARRAAEATDARLLEVRGRTFILYRPKRKAINRPKNTPDKASQP
jgi:RNA-binding protein